MSIPANPKIYHIVHVDRLPSIIADGCLWSDAAMVGRPGVGTMIGMNSIKQRRMNELTLDSRPGLYVWSLNRLFSARPSRLMGVMALRLPWGRCQL